jgi:4-hydroxythreonine-4-phosphate dehydrogenase
MNKPIVLTCGDPAGIGPEVAQKSWDHLRGGLPFVWIGDPRHLPLDIPFQTIDDLHDVPHVASNAMPVLRHDFANPVHLGKPDFANAQGVIDVIARAVDLVKSGAASAICTAPISKAVLQNGAGFAYPGHTEYLAALDGGCDVVMMLASDQLRVVPTTIHIPLAQVPDALTSDLLERTIRITHAALQTQFGIKSPRLAVSGLNPHAGEDGRMGKQEHELITPILNKLRDQGFDIRGPLPADTMFHARARAGYDVAICMYHDQALIPIKTLDFDMGVNVTLGLSFVRTSPDHGTAFDIAGQNAANPSSTLAALKLAAQLGTGHDRN